MTMDAAARKAAGKELGRQVFVVTNKLASMDWDHLSAAVGSIDDTMDALPGVLNGAQTVKQNFIARLPEPFKSTSTQVEKAQALMVWAMKEVGLI